jgi:hypothetical protein
MDEAVLVSVIVERPTYLPCTAAKVGETQLGTLRAIERMGTLLRLTVEPGGRCRSCGRTVGPVYWLARAV